MGASSSPARSAAFGAYLRMGSHEVKATAVRERERAAFLIHELKTLDENAGIIEGYVAVFTNLDGNGDVIDRGAFTKTLREAHETKDRNKVPYLYPLLWQHRESEPIGGILEAHEDDHGLFIRGQYDMSTELGQRAYSGAKMGYLRGLSIGYDPVKTLYRDKARHLTEVKLWEGSPVTFPANMDAQVIAVKQQEGPDETKGASGKSDWPIADRDVSWDNGAAHKRLLDWAGGKDDLDTAKFSSVHFFTPDDKTKVSDYKLAFCDVIGGEVKAIPKAIFAVAGALQGARGGVKDVPADAIKPKVSAYYGRMAKQFDDDGIKVPWSAKSMNEQIRAELKDLSGLTALTGCARALDNVCDGAEGLIETLAGSCGFSLESGGNIGEPEAPVAALLAGLDGLEGAVKAVITSWQEFDRQTDALLSALGLPDDDYDHDYAVPMYMSHLRSAFELKAGRQLSANNRERLSKHMGVLQDQVAEVKSILNDNDANVGLSAEMGSANDYGDVVAAGRHNPPKSRERYGSGQKPGAHGDTTSSGTTGEPEDDSTLTAFHATLMRQKLDLLRSGIAQ